MYEGISEIVILKPQWEYHHIRQQIWQKRLETSANENVEEWKSGSENCKVWKFHTIW